MDELAEREVAHKGSYEAGKGEMLTAFYVVSTLLSDLATTLEHIDQGRQRTPTAVRTAPTASQCLWSYLELPDSVPASLCLGLGCRSCYCTCVPPLAVLVPVTLAVPSSCSSSVGCTRVRSFCVPLIVQEGRYVG